MFPVGSKVSNTGGGVVYKMQCSSSSMKIIARLPGRRPIPWFPFKFQGKVGRNFINAQNFESKNSYGFGVMPETTSQYEFCFLENLNQTVCGCVSLIRVTQVC